MFGNYLLILKVALFTKQPVATCLLWLLICVTGHNQLIRVEVYFVYQTGFFCVCVCKGKKYAVLTTWKTFFSIAKLMYLIAQIMEGFSINKHTLRARVLH